MPEPPRTAEGWFALHDFRTVDWDGWRTAPERERSRAVEEGIAYLRRHEAVEDAGEGASAVFSVLGHEADLLVLHFRPTADDLSAAERAFERTALAGFTGRAGSYVSVTEVSGYASEAYFEEGADVDEGLRRYMEGKLRPEIPDDGYVSFYPMSKRRGESDNWYDLPFERRAELMAGHGEVGKRYAGRIRQVIASSVGLDDFEWGVTLFADDLTDIKDVVYEMRFDEASARYGEFGAFSVGRRFPPADLGAYLRGERVPTGGDGGDGERAREHHPGTDDPRDGRSSGGGDGGDPGDGDAAADIRGELADLDVYAGRPHGEDVHATVVYSGADPDALAGEVDDLRESFDHYDTHAKTAVYEGTRTERSAVASVWETADAAGTAAGFLSDLPGIVARAGEGSGFGTMGMFYTVKPEHRGEFRERFDDVEELLEGMDGHVETDLMVNREDGDQMFIASQWRSREDAMEFFRSEAFRETVQWGRDVLADRPRHVFLA